MMRRWIFDFWNLLFPRCCLVCGKPVSVGEESLCICCLSQLPRTDYHLQPDNPAEKLFWGQIDIERATSYFHYERGGIYKQLLYQLKYGGCKEIGEMLGRYMAVECMPSGFFKGIDLIIPVPLHQSKQKERGYNQSEWLAKGISSVTGIPVRTDILLRTAANTTQTHQTFFQRRENVEKAFTVTSAGIPDGKHILLVDDVLTTGSTLLACARALGTQAHPKISVLTLAIAGI